MQYRNVEMHYRTEDLLHHRDYGVAVYRIAAKDSFKKPFKIISFRGNRTRTNNFLIFSFSLTVFIMEVKNVDIVRTL